MLYLNCEEILADICIFHPLQWGGGFYFVSQPDETYLKILHYQNTKHLASKF
jgi:hypothetical protein